MGACGSTSGHRLVGLEYLLGDGHLQFIHFVQVWKSAIGLTVEDLIPVQKDLQSPLSRRREFYCNVTGVLRSPKFRRQPRGDREIASRDAIGDINFYFAKFGAWHRCLQILGYEMSVINGLLDCNKTGLAPTRAYGIIAVPCPMAVVSLFWFSHTSSTDTKVPLSTVSLWTTLPRTVMVSPSFTGLRNLRFTVPV